jgi:hypothetical protein
MSSGNDQMPISIEQRQEGAYLALGRARRAAGLARLSMGLQLVILHDTDGWQGKTGAVSFRRFLQEEGIEPTSAYQYMEVARAFILNHLVDPSRIALVSMRVLVAASRYLRPAKAGEESNAEEVVSLVTALPPAEAQEALRERFELNENGKAAVKKQRISTPVAAILGRVDGLTHEGRSELMTVLRLAPPSPSPPPPPPPPLAQALPAGPSIRHPGRATPPRRPDRADVLPCRVVRRPAVIAPEPPFPFPNE